MSAKPESNRNAVPGGDAAAAAQSRQSFGAGAGRSLPLAARMFLISAGLITLAVAVSLFITWQQGRRIAGDTVAQAIATSMGVQQESTQARLDLLETTIQAIAADPAVAGYFENAVVDSQLGLGDGDGDGTVAGALSLHDLLLERQSEYRFDLGIFLDADGNVAARSDEVEAVADNMSADPFLRTSIERAVALSGFWRQGARLYQAAIVPIDRDQNLLGFLLLARAVDTGFARRIGKVSGADIAYVAAADGGPVLFSSSLPEGAATALIDALRRNPEWQNGGTKSDTGKVLALSLAGKPWIARVRPLDVDAGASLGQSLTLLPITRAYAGYRKLLELLALTGLCSLLVALPASYWLAKRVLRPVTAMAAAARRAAGGDYHSEIRYRGNDELASLAQSFDQLLSELREKSDIEGYVGNLARFLPEPRDEPGARSVPSATPAVPLAAGHWVLLAVECRALQRSLDAVSAGGMPVAVGAFISAIDRLGQRDGSDLLLISGARVLLGFSGEAGLATALASASQLQRDSSLDATLRSELAFAVHAGALVRGQLSVCGKSLPLAAGASVYQIERLLAEAPVGFVFVAKPLLPVLAGLIAAPVQACTGVLSGRSYPALPVAALQQLPPLPHRPTQDDQGTRVAPSAVTATGGRHHSDDAAIGNIFGERYQIVAKLGSGGMGVVYKARDLELDDLVAIKMLRSDAKLDAEQLDRLKSELKLARRITHPNVLRTFDFGEHQGRPYLSMEYVRGMTLRYLLQQTGRIPFSAALRIARQLCAGLEAAHQVGVLHRDIKPENLILEQSGNAKLMDFGIARPIRRVEPGHTQPGMFLGTPHYSAPEQLAGEEVDHRADIYAVGVLLCEMFCGRLPYAGANTMEIYLAQMQQEPIRPSQYWAEIPPALEAIILRCLARRADDRYPSASELAADLGAVRG